MRVLHLGAGNIYGGIERALVAYAAGRTAWPEMEPHYGLAFPGQFEAELRAAGVDVTLLGPVRLRSPRSVVSARSGVRNLLDRSRPDVVVTHGPWAHCVFAPPARKAGIPLVLFFHNPPTIHWLDIMARRLLPDLALVNSQYTLDRTRWWLGATPAAVCSYPIGRLRAPGRDYARLKFGLSPETVLILQASRLDPYKGHRLHLRALAELKAEPTWCAWFAGGAQPGKEAYHCSLLSLRDSLGLTDRVHFLGHRTDVAALMHAADIFCHPNTKPEAFGIAFVEAMQAGLPVVSTAMGGANEIFASGGGVLVQPNTMAVAAALRELVRDDRERAKVGARGRDLAAERYSVESGVRELGFHLSGLIQKSRPSERRSAWG